MAKLPTGFIPDDYSIEEVDNQNGIVKFDIDKPREVYFNLGTVFNGRQLDRNVSKTFQILKSGRPLNLKGCTLGFHGEKPDSNEVVVYGTSTVLYGGASGMVQFDFPAQTFTAVGYVKGHFVITDGKGTDVSTHTFFFDVEEDFIGGAFDSKPFDSDYENWKQQINQKMTGMLQDVNNANSQIEILKSLIQQYTADVNTHKAALMGTDNKFTGTNIFGNTTEFDKNITLANDADIVSPKYGRYSDMANNVAGITTFMEDLDFKVYPIVPCNGWKGWGNIYNAAFHVPGGVEHQIIAMNFTLITTIDRQMGGSGGSIAKPAIAALADWQDIPVGVRDKSPNAGFPVANLIFHDGTGNVVFSKEVKAQTEVHANNFYIF